ncbi:MAG TPA: metalloregulator ArsR/SmtB family transcription factor [Pseudogracilibacillus sp.]|nr:metalloregulator ArsR/SmtB family transcription factor [Pseudogracilibacillus sp.]
MPKTVVKIDEAADVFKLLGNQTRLTMLKMLNQRDSCVCDFVEIFQMSQPAISQHLRKLRDLGLVTEERKGQWNFYSLKKNNEFYSFIIELLNLIDDQDEKLNQFKEETGISCN